MPLAVASRFAVLRIDDDVDDGPKKSQKKIVDGKKVDPKKKNKQDTGKVNQSIQNAASKPKGKVSNPTLQKKKAPTAEQWAEWQKKDAEVADGNFEVDLHQAMLLSKVDYEKNKDLYEQRKLAALEEKKVPVKKSKKMNKPQPMSLDQFNNLNSKSREPDCVVEPQINGSLLEEEDGAFFDRIKDDAKVALQRETQRVSRKHLPSRVPDIDKAITQAQYEVTLENKDQEISTLNEEVKKLKEELHSVKTRNKKLCQLLANGEMKDKAQLLIELDRMHQVKDELSSEVSSLHILLEQERSKNHALTTDPKNKAQSKKRVASESMQ